MTPLKANQMVAEILTVGLSTPQGEIPKIHTLRDELVELISADPSEAFGIIAALTAYALSTTQRLAALSDSDPLDYVQRRALAFEAKAKQIDQMIEDWYRDHPGGLS